MEMGSLSLMGGTSGTVADELPDSGISSLLSAEAVGGGSGLRYYQPNSGFGVSSTAPAESPYATPILGDGGSELADTIAQLWEFQRAQTDSLEKLRAKQQHLLQDPSKELFEETHKFQEELRNNIDNQVRTIDKLFEEHVMPLQILNQWISLRQNINLQSVQLRLYQEEILQLTDYKPPEPQSFAALVIGDQPVGDVIFKNKQATKPYTVHLLTGANVELSVMGNCQATVVCDNQLWKRNFSRKPISEDNKVLQPHMTSLQFHPKFLVGTRKNTVGMKFTVPVRTLSPTGENTHTLESSVSSPVIVITNECQWVQAEKCLIIREAFGTSADTMWQRFANTFILQFLRSTRQDQYHPQRTLTLHDMEYLHDKFFESKPKITLKDFEKFWGWLGKGLHTLRYQKSVGNMWKAGLIYGLIDKDEVTRAVAEQASGSFLIRFSERHSGSFAVAYKHLDSVKHYLVQPSDTAGPKRTLPDFLWNCPQFIHVLKVTHDPLTGAPVLAPHRKETALASYVSPAPVLQVEGYDDLPS